MWQYSRKIQVSPCLPLIKNKMKLLKNQKIKCQLFLYISGDYNNNNNNNSYITIIVAIYFFCFPFTSPHPFQPPLFHGVEEVSVAGFLRRSQQDACDRNPSEAQRKPWTEPQRQRLHLQTQEGGGGGGGAFWHTYIYIIIYTFRATGHKSTLQHKARSF